MNPKRLETSTLLAKVIGTKCDELPGDLPLSSLFREDSGHEVLLAARELTARYLEEEMRQGDYFTCPNYVGEYLRLHFKGKEAESFVVLFLNNQHRLLAVEEMFQGTIANASVHPREVVKRALHWNAAAIIVAHNHPSGYPEPSAADRNITSTLKSALQLIEVRVLDHFVVADTRIVSFASQGLM